MLSFNFFCFKRAKTKKQIPIVSTSKKTPTQTDLNTAAKETTKDNDLIILKQFDLNIKYGPCYNIKRLQRWNWANGHNLKPPEKVKQLVDANQNDTDYTESIWYCYRSIL